MLPLTRILCPVDFSRHAEKALTAAKDLAAEFDAAVLVVHVNPPVFGDNTIGYNAPKVDFNVSPYLEELEKKAQASLDRLVEEHFQDSPLGIETHVAYGNEADQITELADREKADLIVLSTHGKTGVKRWLLGSVAEGVIRRASQPVLAVRITEKNTSSSKNQHEEANK